ncbi:DUF2301 domain-containing membrane protein [Photobacterium chitinilyticum]|uniref:Uncharacterized protein n=1 Tax=Photobacterium chitinilyticum TaxID=2485123 RepID=A0A444JPI4_9GAMM|nr:DUF2301 domain-containing membrane protein [Photobacterium chitinilyticum]RWX54996.1 hypothetical protein EDI28_14770 [Photobacterium chitinilyticum]
MADPHIQSQLDSLDKLTVILYRGALTASAAIMLLMVWGSSFAISAMVVAALIAACTVHIYDKRFRWLIVGSGMFASIWLTLDIWPPLALGAALFTFSALAIKEYFCFRLKILTLTPLTLAAFWFCFAFGQEQISIAFGIIGAILLATAAIAKWRMPIHYDIGDKSRYQV